MKMKVGLSLEEITVKRVEVMATATRRDKSAIVDMAVELLAQQDEFANLDSVVPLAKIDPSSIKGVSKGKVA
jgi:predicted transcriptional regulator